MKNIYIIPTEKPSRLILDRNYILNELMLRDSQDYVSAHIYITSDEKIKDEDWCLYFNKFGSKIVCKAKLTDTGFVYQELGEDYIGREDEGITPLKSEISKIILTTDPELIADGVQEIDDKFLQWFVHNPSCEFVEIEKGMFFESDNYHFYKIIIPERGFTIT